MAEEKKKGSLWAEFKAFINRGNVVDMAVGVIIGGAFGAIVTAVTNILLSVCTWAVPGGLSGLVTVLPAASDAQKGIAGIGQTFAASDLSDMARKFAAANGVPQVSDDALPQWISQLTDKYNLKGSIYVFKQSAVIDWGALINAVISFLIIAIVLFTILKVYTALKTKRQEIQASLKKGEKGPEAK